MPDALIESTAPSAVTTGSPSISRSEMGRSAVPKYSVSALASTLTCES